MQRNGLVLAAVAAIALSATFATAAVREDGSVADILPELAVLAGFAIVLITIAGLRLRRSMTVY